MTDSWILKLDRAQKHLEEFDEEVAVYIDKHAYRAVRTIRPKCKEHGDCWRYRLEITEQPDPNLAVILGDVTHNLRSALDHIAVGLAPKRRKTSTFFPIITEDIEYGFLTPNRAQLEARQRFDRAVEGMAPEAVAIIQRAQPYNLRPERAHETHLLGVLSRLDNADKHRQLIVLSSGLGDAKTTVYARRYELTQGGPMNTMVENDAQILHFTTEKLWPPASESEMYVQIRGTQLITVDVGLGPNDAFRVEGIHELIPEIRNMFAALDPYVRRPRTPPRGHGPEATRPPTG
jgi:hypothetical protein